MRYIVIAMFSKMGVVKRVGSIGRRELYVEMKITLLKCF